MTEKTSRTSFQNDNETRLNTLKSKLSEGKPEKLVVQVGSNRKNQHEKSPQEIK